MSLQHKKASLPVNVDLDHSPLSVHTYQRMSLSAKNNQQKAIISFIPLILDNDFRMSINFQIQSSRVARPKGSLLLSFKNTI